MGQQPVRVITEQQVRRSLTVTRSIELARTAMLATADGSALDSSLGHLRAPRGEFHLKASGLRVDGRLYVCVKVGACFYGRPAQLGLPSIVGLIQLFDGDTGQPLAIMESARITALRTAAATAVAVGALSRPDARSLAICGAGEQAAHHVRAIASVRDLSRVSIWSRRRDSAEDVARALESEFPHLSFTVDGSAAATVADADIVATLTPATRPYLTAREVARGTFIAAVGSDAPDKNELDPALVAASTVVCDVVHQCVRVGELHHAVEAGLMTPDDVGAELGQVLAGRRRGRTSEEEIVVFDSTGTAVQDTAAAVAVYRDTLDADDPLTVDLWAE
jgi:alanine dehydrogenase